MFHVYNSSQSILTDILPVDATKIPILAEEANDPEIWADNGFIKIEDEIIYYDEVERDGNGKICTFKKCLRAIEGTAKEYLPKTHIFGTVIAQHHNRLVEAIVAIENTLGDISQQIEQAPVVNNFSLAASVDYGFSTSLASSVQNLLGFSMTGDDVCPDVEFIINSTVPVPGGTQAEYCVRVFGWQDGMGYRLDFGDGTQTTTEFSGVHTWAAGGPYVPVASITSTKCNLIIQPSSLGEGDNLDPFVPAVQPFSINIPDVPDFPTFLPPSTTCPGPLFNLPPLLINGVQVCSTISMSNASSSSTSSLIPSSSDVCSVIVSIVGCCLPSVISLQGCCPPSLISYTGCCPPSFISYTGCCPPSVISFTGTIPSTININLSGTFPSVISFAQVPSFALISFATPPTFTPITFATPPSFAPITFATPPSFGLISFATPPTFTPITFATPPSISVVWGTPPTVSCVVTIQCPCSSTPTVPMGMLDGNFGMAPDLEEASLPVTFENVGIPEEIRLIVPKIPDMKLVHDLPLQIGLNVPKIPDIRIIGPEISLPETIHIDASDVPKSIKLESNLPKSILLEKADNLPSVFRLEAFGIPEEIKVTGFPQSIEVIGVPREIQLVMPKDPTIELVYKGPPQLELKINSDLEKLLSQIAIMAPGK